MQIGLVIFPTDFSIDMVELAKAAEARGFESLWVTEHTHIPTSRLSQRDGIADLPPEYSHTLDPFVALTAAAAATDRLRLGTGVCLVTEHDPIVLAKEVASLDLLSQGRFQFGIGAGWNREEMENHGTDPKLRWRVLRERVLAMKEIWTKDEAEFHGQHVDFDPIWSWPKPAQRPHPPVLMGGDAPKAIEGLLEYCDEWLPRPARGERPFPERLAEVQQQAARAGRGPIPFTLFGAPAEPKALEVFQHLGAKRCLLRLPSAPAEEVLPLLDRYAETARGYL
jgi:probable F420-dependent oxidoreductase